MSIEVSNEVTVKNEPICYSQTIKANKVKGVPMDIEIQTSKSQIKSKSEKFSATEEFANKRSIQTASIAFLNEDATVTTSNNNNQIAITNQETTNNCQPIKPKSK